MKPALVPPIPFIAIRRDRSRILGTIARITFTIMTLFGISRSALAQGYTASSLYSFGPDTTDGYYLYGSLINVNGLFYGTTRYGGANNTGTIFSFSPTTHTKSTLYSFSAPGLGDGAYPEAALTYDSSTGKLFGTTAEGGSDRGGTIFSIDLSTHAVSLVYNFQTSVGNTPQAAMVDVQGTLYGTTKKGGAADSGTIFSFTTSGSNFKTLYTFTAANGEGGDPVAAMVYLSTTKKLYGTTNLSGSDGNGTVFSFDPATNTEKTLYGFKGYGHGDGAYPAGGLTYDTATGKLYGTTQQGGNSNDTYGDGTIYSLDPATNQVSLLYKFNTLSFPDGTMPVADLILDSGSGKFYGTTSAGGSDGHGTFFSFDPATNMETNLYSFTGDKGTFPYGSLIETNGVFYGNTYLGGTSNFGNIFSLTIPVIPKANNDSGRGIANHTIVIAAPGVLGNDNLGGDPNTTAAIVTQPAHGTIAFNGDGSFTYTPHTGFVGGDSFTYKDTNLAGTSNIATCALTIGPVAYPDNGRTYFNTAVVIGAPGVLGNDATGGLSTTASLMTSPTHGSITFSSNGGFTYTPTSGFLGTDSFTYKIANTAGTSAPATCTMTVQARTPIANNDAGRVTHNTTLTITAPGVLGNDNPGTTGTVTAAIVTNPTHGTITFNSNGSFVYKPTTGFIGTDSFTYKDTNSVGTSNTATCTLTVQ